jgi:pyruvate dehydrogenase E1 component alpha subunit
MIEAFTYRMGAHTTTDDPTRYRASSELEHWKLKDPIERVKAYLTRSGAADADFFTALDSEAEELAEHLRSYCRSLPNPEPTSIFDHVYVDQTPNLTQQREEMAAYLDSFAEEGSR